MCGRSLFDEIILKIIINIVQSWVKSKRQAYLKGKRDSYWNFTQNLPRESDRKRSDVWALFLWKLSKNKQIVIIRWWLLSNQSMNFNFSPTLCKNVRKWRNSITKVEWRKHFNAFYNLYVRSVKLKILIFSTRWNVSTTF